MNDLSASVITMERAARRIWPLTVVDAFYVTPRRRRVRLVSEVDGFSYRPGQTLRLMLCDAVLRHYRVRDFDPVEERLDVDFILRSGTPSALWARTAKLGDRVAAVGLRRPPRSQAVRPD